ncbi:YdcF family protein [Brucella suis]|uniref:YdcF family protein n=1 Tax=Brucella suis TaxID=29461 RepID=UPI0002CD9F8C|nr:YdcF family protein [Brucella suis]ENT63880.1 hypothetical protein C008_01668 [Brucella suis F9/06-1]
MSFFPARTVKKLQISGNFSSYRRSAGYDSKIRETQVTEAASGGYWTGDDAVAQRRTGSSSQANIWRRSHQDAFVPSFLGTPARFAWSVMMRILRRLQPVSIILFLAVIAFLGGFLVFSEKVTGMQPPVLSEPAEAIVVLTGGQSRVKAGINLLKEKRGKRLLISGVHPSTNEEALQRATHADKSLFACCIDLDRTALNTVGNAAESERWIRANNYHRVIVVTNNYHIPRSILEMSSRMKDVEFIPYPVVNGEKREQSWVAEGDTLRVLFTEYVKYLGAVVRLGSASFYGNGASHGGDMRE